MKHMVYIIRDIQLGQSIPLYVGRGLTDYSHGKRPKGWSRVDMHRSQLKKVRTMMDRGEPLPNLFSLYQALVERERAGAIIDFQVVFETNDDVQAVMKEAEITQSLRRNHPGLLNVTNISGAGDRPNRVKPKWTDEQRKAQALRMTGQKRGSYILSEAGKEARIRTANANRKCYRLPADQHKRRRLDRASVNRQLRLGQISAEECARLLAEIDSRFLVS